MLSRRRDLITGRSVWQGSRASALGSDALDPRERPDAIVIGTGVSGAVVADALQQSGLSVVAVDRRRPMTGSTPASTALLLFELDTPLTNLARTVGKDGASQAWLRSVGAVQALSDRIADLGIDCDFRERCSIYLPGDVLDVTGLKREAAARRRLGLRSEFLTRDDLLRIAGLRKAGAILSRGSGECDPVKLVAGVWRKFRAGGGKVVSPFDAVDVDETASRVRVTGANGRRIDAMHAVMCTGYEFPKYVLPKGYRIISTWALATRPQPRQLWPGRHLIWEASDPYLYMRTTLDGRIIAGGTDEDFSDEQKRDRLIGSKTVKIAALAQRLFPAADFTPHYSWTGNFGESETGMPAIGLLRGRKRTYAVLGFGGNGITFSMLAAQIVSRTINGIADPDLALFRL